MEECIAVIGVTTKDMVEKLKNGPMAVLIVGKKNHGKGTFRCPDGTVYTGTFVNDKFQNLLNP